MTKKSHIAADRIESGLLVTHLTVYEYFAGIREESIALKATACKPSSRLRAKQQVCVLHGCTSPRNLADTAGIILYDRATPQTISRTAQRSSNWKAGSREQAIARGAMERPYYYQNPLIDFSAAHNRARQHHHHPPSRILVTAYRNEGTAPAPSARSRHYRDRVAR